MSQCPQCYTGTCARHRRQDHGKSKVAMPANSQQTLQKMYDMLVGSKLQKLQAESERDPSTQSTEKFRQQLDASRDKNIKKSSSKSANRRVPAAATGSGLNPQALAALYNDSDDESGSDRKKTKKSRKSSSKKSKKHKKDKKSSSS
uniref:Uncharacterized protein n=1 Tax=Globisporangium ultimum (strain ATCC 200006 / CBS 805.95 / DAOM BR144) TaxID=431595 RepID=K3WW33_GLOUD